MEVETKAQKESTGLQDTLQTVGELGEEALRKLAKVFDNLGEIWDERAEGYPGSNQTLRSQMRDRLSLIARHARYDRDWIVNTRLKLEQGMEREKKRKEKEKKREEKKTEIKREEKQELEEERLPKPWGEREKDSGIQYPRPLGSVRG